VRSVNIAELKNRLSTYIGYAKNGEEVVIRDRKVPVARLVPFVPGSASEEEEQLIAEGKLRPAKEEMTPEWIEEFLKMPRPTARGKSVTQALLEEREEGW